MKRPALGVVLAFAIPVLSCAQIEEEAGPTPGAGAIERGLEWLETHQDADGKWDSAGFMAHDLQGEATDGPGGRVHNVGITALALLAFLGDGNTMRSGPYQDVVNKAVVWLRDQQGDNGLFGTNASHDYIYDHTLATLAMIEAYGLSDFKLLKRYAQNGIDYLESHRNPYAVWRYQPRDGGNDTSVTSWAVKAYRSAMDFDLEVNRAALANASTWFDDVTNGNGQAGYTLRGELSSRNPGDHSRRFPPDRGEALTAAALRSRLLLGQDPEEDRIMHAAADTILGKPPVWDVEAGTIDHYYWYYATYALYRMGGQRWADWSRHLTDAVVETQRTDGNYRGSWDPIGVWGESGGRIYSTALMLLTLQAYYRYSHLVR